MNKPIDARLLQPAEAFADYLKNTAARIDAVSYTHLTLPTILLV